MKSGVWSVECGAFCCVCVCLCLCLSLYGREVTVVTVGYGRLRGSMGATFCHLAALLFGYWISILGSLGNGHIGPNPSREVTGGHGSKLLPFGGRSRNSRFGPNPGREVTGGHGRSREQIAAIWRPLAKQPFWAKSWPGGHGRSREVTGGQGRSRKVTGGHGRLGGVTGGYGRLWKRKTEESGGTGGKR